MQLYGLGNCNSTATCSVFLLIFMYHSSTLDSALYWTHPAHRHDLMIFSSFSFLPSFFNFFFLNSSTQGIGMEGDDDKNSDEPKNHHHQQHHQHTLSHSLLLLLEHTLTKQVSKQQKQ